MMIQLTFMEEESMATNTYSPDKDPTVTAQRKKNLILFQLDWLVSQDPIRWYLFIKGVHEARLSFRRTVEALLNYTTAFIETAASLPELREALKRDLEYCVGTEKNAGDSIKAGPSDIRWDECLSCIRPGDAELASWMSEHDHYKIAGFIELSQVYTNTWALITCGAGTALSERFLGRGEND